MIEDGAVNVTASIPASASAVNAQPWTGTDHEKSGSR